MNGNLKDLHANKVKEDFEIFGKEGGDIKTYHPQKTFVFHLVRIQ